MPTYSFRNEKTGEEFTEFMSISDREKFLSENAHITQLVNGAPLISSGVNLKPDQGFRDLLKEMKKKHSQGISRSTINTW